MRTITLDAEAGQVSTELVRRGIGVHTRVHVIVEVNAEQDSLPPLAVIAQQGGAFDWLDNEPDLYTDADLVQRTP